MIVLDIRDLNKRATLCIMPLSLRGEQNIKEARNKWVYDIRFFKEKCQDKRPFVAESFEDDPYIVKRKNEILTEQRQKFLEKLKEKEEEKQQGIFQKNVEKAAKVALQAVEKELNYEQLIIREELLKEKKEQTELQKQIQEEKAKKESVENQLSQKAKPQLDDQYQEKIKEIENQAVMQVQQARAKTEEKLEQMRRVADIKKRDTKRQISRIRNQIASTILNEGRIGNILLCNPTQTQEEKLAYCEKNLKDDPSKLDDCKNNSDEFCYTCCETEFGNIHKNLQDKCIIKCDDFSGNKITDWTVGNEIFNDYTQ